MRAVGKETAVHCGAQAPPQDSQAGAAAPARPMRLAPAPGRHAYQLARLTLPKFKLGCYIFMLMVVARACTGQWMGTVYVLVVCTVPALLLLWRVGRSPALTSWRAAGAVAFRLAVHAALASNFFEQMWALLGLGIWPLIWSSTAQAALAPWLLAGGSLLIELYLSLGLRVQLPLHLATQALAAASVVWRVPALCAAPAAANAQRQGLLQFFRGLFGLVSAVTLQQEGLLAWSSASCSGDAAGAECVAVLTMLQLLNIVVLPTLAVVVVEVQEFRTRQQQGRGAQPPAGWWQRQYARLLDGGLGSLVWFRAAVLCVFLFGVAWDLCHVFAARPVVTPTHGA